MVIPLRNYYRCHSGVCSTVVTRAMARRRVAEIQTPELARDAETVVDVLPLLDLPDPLSDPSPVSELILEDPITVTLEQDAESVSEASAGFELSDLAILGSNLDCEVQTVGPSLGMVAGVEGDFSGEREVCLVPHQSSLFQAMDLGIFCFLKSDTTTMKLSELLNALLNVSEKGANIARIIRSESSLLDLLVQEKKGDQKNQRFLQDFKTLADVLVQELVRYDLVQQFPGLRGSIHGEESNKFTNTLGESVSVSIKLTREETSSLLATVLDDDKTAADLLSAVVHSPVHISQHQNSGLLDLTLAVEDIGVWIDPIDSTAQYIQGQVGEMNPEGLVSEGLQCVCVLIGVYEKMTGLPVLGVINQPFYKYIPTDDRWTGHITWGVHHSDVKVTSFSQEYSRLDRKKPILLMSSSESAEMKDIFSQDFDVKFVTGAGYKLLCVSEGLADAYVLTKNSIFKWDCCGPHAVLQASDGGIVKCNGIIECLKQTGSLTEMKTVETFHKTSQIKYHKPDCPELSGAQKWCNDGGIIAYRSVEVLQKIVLALEKSP